MDDIEVAAQLVFVAGLVARRLPVAWMLRAGAASTIALVGAAGWMSSGSWFALAQLVVGLGVALVETVLAFSAPARPPRMLREATLVDDEPSTAGPAAA